MTPDQYHGILVALTEAEKLFEAHTAEWSADDQQLYQALRFIRTEVLKRESGHPFPNLGLAQAMAAVVALGNTPAVPPAPPEANRKIRVVIVDDENSVRTVVRLLVSTAADMEVVGEADNGRAGIEKAIACQPDVIIMDLNMPVLTGLEATQSILRVLPGSKIIMFTANHERSCVHQAAEAGAIGFIFKPARKNELLSAIRAAYAGQENIGELQTLVTAPKRDSVQVAQQG